MWTVLSVYFGINILLTLLYLFNRKAINAKMMEVKGMQDTMSGLDIDEGSRLLTSATTFSLLTIGVPMLIKSVFKKIVKKK